ncbi:MAG: carbohydrate ABC transporter permease [Clostridia bacterium]|nr:carbohydrate ABC transporter permease [Clostridia bacterium]
MKQSKLNKMPLKEGVFIYGFIIVFMVLVLVPFTVLVSSSLSSTVSIRANGARPWIQDFSTDAYRIVFMYPAEMLKSYLVSIIVTVAGTFINVILVATSAFAISRPQFRGKRIVSFYYSFTVMFQAGFIPNYIWFRNYLNIFNTYWVLILTPAFMVGHLILLRAFYSGLPESLYEAVKIDGANEFTIFFKIATPLIIPGIATVCFYSVLTYWNDPFTAMLYTDDFIPVALYLTRITQYIEFLKYAQQNGFSGVDFNNLTIPEDTIVYAIAIATTAPMLCIFVVFQKYFVRGLTTGAVKG